MDKTRLRDSACKGLTAAGVVAALVVSVLFPANRAYAQSGGDPLAAQLGYVKLHGSGGLFGVAGEGEIPVVLRAEKRLARKLERTAPGDIRRSLDTLVHGPGVASNGKPVPAFQASSGSHRSIGRKVAGGVLGALGGFWAGGFLGAKMQSDCRCDDPGLQGFIIGAPVGAVIGGILGAKFF